MNESNSKRKTKKKKNYGTSKRGRSRWAVPSSTLGPRVFLASSNCLFVCWLNQSQELSFPITIVG
ncbi:hypothetical protein HanRHA438_Chr06g0252921 [Helianthus annuus]|nr:hypothetical protein HanRHA438_Chr06g0252921 [Helianthus annuus]